MKEYTIDQLSEELSEQTEINDKLIKKIAMLEETIEDLNCLVDERYYQIRELKENLQIIATSWAQHRTVARALYAKELTTAENMFSEKINNAQRL